MPRRSGAASIGIDVSPALLIAQVEHGPQLHGVIPVVIVAIVLIGGLAYLLQRGRKRSGRDSGSDHRSTAPRVSAPATDATVRSDGARPSVVPVVDVRSLTKRYGEVNAVEALSFSLEAGTVTGFLGPNGAGKTTTLRVLLGLAEPTSGEALVFGRRYRELDQPARRVGAVLESNDFHPGRSGRDHLRALALAAEIPSSRVEEVLELVELDAAAGRRVKTYSLGMRQRLGLAAALLGEPELLVLDEPANGLDPAGVHWLRTFLRRFAEEGGTVLVASHLLAEVAQTVDRVLIIDRGRLLAGGRLDELAGRGQTLEDAYLELTAGSASL
jgi:ABC-2 type transport system ATP-binding protein